MVMADNKTNETVCWKDIMLGNGSCCFFLLMLPLPAKMFFFFHPSLLYVSMVKQPQSQHSEVFYNSLKLTFPAECALLDTSCGMALTNNRAPQLVFFTERRSEGHGPQEPGECCLPLIGETH